MSPSQTPPRLIRGINVAVTATCTVTLTWIGWGLFTPGDFFGQGSIMVLPSLVLAGVLGVLLGWRVRRRATRAVLLIVCLACVAFWILARDGWWASGPPVPRTAPTRPQ